LANWIKKIVPKRFRGETIGIPVVRLQGVIAASSSSPAFKAELSLAACADVLDKAFADKKAPAVAIIVNSPGGSPVQSRLIFKRIRDLAEETSKHVVVFVEDVAASGGYMIACAGDEIIADPSSVLGSIGVVSASFGFPELLKKIGVERRVYTAGKNKASLDPFQPERPGDIDHLKSLQLEIHDVFIQLVKQRRGDKLKDDDDLFTGMFWTGIKAKELGLIDDLGDLRSLMRARYGEKVKLNLISPSHGLLGRKKPGGVFGGQPFDVNFGHSLIEAAINKIEERLQRARFGL